MPDRKQFDTKLTASPELTKLLEEAKTKHISEDELREQRVSYAFGNAEHSDSITKDSVRESSQSLRLRG